MSNTRHLFLFFIVSMAASCATTQRTDLFFGMNIPDGTRVTPEQWSQFSDSVVALQFPEGYTQFDANGKWMDTESKQTITEPTKVLSFVGKKSKERDLRINAIIQHYIERYKQQAVLRIDSKTRVRFIVANKNSAGN